MGASDVALEDRVVESEFAAILLEVPSLRIVAASPAAMRMLAPQGVEVVGRDVNDFTVDDMSGALPLLMAGHLDGYETTHELDHPGGGGPLTIWIRRIDDREPPTHVVAVLTTPGNDVSRLLTRAPGKYVPPVLGSTGPDLLIDRISCDIARLVGTPAEALLGQSLLSLVTPASASELLWGLAQSATHGTGAPLRLELIGADGRAVLVQLLLVPLHPPASCAFSILPRVPAGGDVTALDAHALLAQLARGVDALGTAREVARIAASSKMVQGRLSARELDIVTRLLAGDRVPVIAKALFLSPSTVRNHLSSVFTKVGVHSQQELLDVLRN